MTLVCQNKVYVRHNLFIVFTYCQVSTLITALLPPWMLYSQCNYDLEKSLYTIHLNRLIKIIRKLITFYNWSK